MNIGIVIGLIKALAPGGDPAVIEQAVTDWLDDHPEATTTVQDGSITEAKLAQDVLADLAEIDGLKEAIGNQPGVGLFQKCELITETSANVFDKSAVQVGMLHMNGTAYTGGSYDNYRYGALTGVVHEGDVIKFYTNIYDYVHVESVTFVVAYDASGNVQSDKGAQNVNTYTVPAGVSSLKVTMGSGSVDYLMAMINPDGMPDDYIPYGEGDTYYVAGEGFIPKSKKITINLPSKMYALSGYELNIYFENIAEHSEDYEWNCDCDCGQQMARGFRITPTNANAGDHTLTITATAKDGTETTVSATLTVVADSAGSGSSKSVIVLGDSTTANGMMVTKLNTNFSDDVMGVSTLGTQGTSPNLHEGRSGWKFSDYFTKAADQTYPTIVNGFYNPTSQTFDASYYFANSGVEKPDWFFINLGINDMFGFVKESALDTQIASCIDMCDDMITSIKTASPATKIGICVTIPPNHSQDAFGKAYSCGQTRERYKHNNVKWASELIKEYDKRTAEGIYLVPIHVNLDTVYNMGMESIPVNARNTETYDSPIGNGGVHPVESGYWQIADVFTAFLKANV